MGKGIASSVHGEVEIRDPGGTAQGGGGRLYQVAHSKVRQQSPVAPPMSPQLFCACSAYVFLLTILSFSLTMKRKCPWVFSMGRKEVSLASALVSLNMCYNLTNPKALMDRRGGETGKGWFIWSWCIWMSRAKLGSLISTVAVTYFRWIAMERPISAPFIWRLTQCLAQGPVKN